MEFVVMSYNPSKTYYWTMHKKGCSDIDRELKGIHTDSGFPAIDPTPVKANDAKEAAAQWIDEELRDMGYDTDAIRINPCCYKQEKPIEQEVQKGMLMFVLRQADGTDCTNGGITSKVTKVIVTGNWIDGSPIPEIFTPTADAPEMRISSHLPQSGYFHAYPVEGLDPGKTPYCFGGNFITSSDSRCPQFPIPVHDRQDTWKDYDTLTR